MTYVFPRLKFADENSALEQVEKIYSEALEVLRAETPEERDHEVADVMQACATYFEIRKREWGGGPEHGAYRVFSICASRDLKNRSRGYEGA